MLILRKKHKNYSKGEKSNLTELIVQVLAVKRKINNAEFTKLILIGKKVRTISLLLTLRSLVFRELFDDFLL